ncbi:MAG: hypothetical protein WA988_16595, partial [Candidatus Nanopelagicales bacterium]
VQGGQTLFQPGEKGLEMRNALGVRAQGDIDMASARGGTVGDDAATALTNPLHEQGDVMIDQAGGMALRVEIECEYLDALLTVE